MFSHPDLLDLKVQAMWLGSRMFVQYLVCCSIVLMTSTAQITEDVIAEQVPAVNFVHKNLNVFPFKSFQFILSPYNRRSHILLLSANLFLHKSTKLPINATIPRTSRNTLHTHLHLRHSRYQGHL